MPRLGRYLIVLVAIFSLISIPRVSAATPQNRMSDHDVEQRMKNLLADTKHFRNSFNTAIGKSIMRKTSQAKDAKQLVETFEGQMQDMLDSFRHSKKADPYLQSGIDTVPQIDKIINDAQINGVTTQQWSKVRTELVDIAQAFNVAVNFR
jgi:hypothetical protein